ncbi:MAG: glycoside hydrolase family 97 protein [Sedimentisphaerales bacterium]|nr:glycoside hydrolase family 97 protein [Sedimentisphaerales bacterium]
MLKKVLFMCLAVGLPSILSAGDFQISSPSGNIAVNVTTGQSILWSVQCGAVQILADSAISLDTSAGVLGKDPVLIADKSRTVDEIIRPEVCEKRQEIRNHFNELALSFEGGYSLEFRVFDNGAAYRFVTDLPGELIVKNEQVDLNFPVDHNFFFPEEGSMVTHYEQLYKYVPLSSVKPEQICSLPFLVDYGGGVKMAFTESDLLDYPGIYFNGTGKPAFTALFPPYVLEEKMRTDRDSEIVRTADYIAKTTGKRSFPWRLLTITTNDAQLIDSQLVYQLASPCVLADTSWIKPGKVAWDWYNDNNVFGVDFRAGVNTETYKYFIDFASAHGLEYIILDEGWYKLGNVLDIADDMDMEELFAYAKSKNVGIILWVVWKTLDDQLEVALDEFQKWGCQGIKMDFMQRDDQYMVNFYEKVAKETAKRHMLLDYHGSYKPTGLRRAYPHIVSREGVKGSENNKWSKQITPEHNTTIPFIRQLAGPMDYTPGCMVNAQEKYFNSSFTTPMSQGTRCHQLAMYVVFESPLQMLCDSPSQYLRESECMEFLAPVPTVWDQTIVQQAAVGDYILIARQSGQEWYAGAMTDWSARELTLDCSFLGKGKYKAIIFKDGINADRYASDYKTHEVEVDAATKLKISMASGGGWAARFIPLP